MAQDVLQLRRGAADEYFIVVDYPKTEQCACKKNACLPAIVPAIIIVIPLATSKDARHTKGRKCMHMGYTWIHV